MKIDIIYLFVYDKKYSQQCFLHYIQSAEANKMKCFMIVLIFIRIHKKIVYNGASKRQRTCTYANHKHSI